MIKVSLVIPAYSETILLPRLLDSVDVARTQFRGGPEAVEVIVADNVSTDGTGALAAERGCTVVTVAQRLIAAARNGAPKWRVVSFCLLSTPTCRCIPTRLMRSRPR